LDLPKQFVTFKILIATELNNPEAFCKC